MQESSHSIESSLQAAGRRQDKSRSPGCPDQWRRGLAQMPTAIRGRSSAQLTQRSFQAYNMSVAKDPVWNKGDSLMPITRRPLQHRCKHLVDPSPCQKQAPHCAWVASTIVAPSGLCLSRVKAPRCVGEQSDNHSTTVLVARHMIQRFIVESSRRRL